MPRIVGSNGNPWFRILHCRYNNNSCYKHKKLQTISFVSSLELHSYSIGNNMSIKRVSLVVKEIIWSESYSLYGSRAENYTIAADDQPVGTYSKYSYYTTCTVCNTQRLQVFSTSSDAITQHFLHCSRSHGYIFPEHTQDKLPVKPVNELLQEIIRASQIYNLPMPGFDNHSACVKQFHNGVPLCLAHVGNDAVEERFRECNTY